MNLNLIPQFKELYKAYKNTTDYEDRVRQFNIVEVNREIIKETLLNNPLTNEHLTGLIQMLKNGCTDATYDKYLKINISNPTKREKILEKASEINEDGYTGAGLNSIGNLDQNQLDEIELFLNEAFNVTKINEAVNFCKNFNDKKIPLVTSGVYSPWLYYINPYLFPILNNSHTKFRVWMDIPSDYPSCIVDFNELKELAEEKDLGLLDRFTHDFEKYSKKTEGLSYLNLDGHNFFKISHGIFKKEYKNTGIVEVLEENNWICMSKYTGHSQGDNFDNYSKIGDFVYVCYGGDDLYCLGKILSDSKKLDEPTSELIDGSDDWIYKEIEPIFFPITSSIREFKKDTRGFMPSGNTTFYQVPNNELDFLNNAIFIPKWNVEIVNENNEIPYSDSFIGETTDQIIKPLNMILYGPPGTGKTYHTINKALEILNIDCNGKSRSEIKRIYDQKVTDGQIVFTTFHQSMSYEDFVEGIKPETKEGRITYLVKPGIFKNICSNAQLNINTDFNQAYDRFISDLIVRKSVELKTITGKPFSLYLNSNNNLNLHTGSKQEKQGTLTKENLIRQINGEQPYKDWNTYFLSLISYLKSEYHYDNQQNFVLIIDEINRGNVSQILGELITLLEEDKREGKKEALSVVLPYSKQSFTVPSNLYIIGTMNTADRSVEAIDTALRRRFKFEEIRPNPTLLLNLLGKTNVDVSLILSIINKRIEILKDRDYQIGHSYFMEVESLEDLIHVFKENIIPLLQEYFFNDYKKIQLVLGTGFITSNPMTVKFAIDDENEFEDKVVYSIQSDIFKNKDNFLRALDQMNIGEK